MLKPVTRLSDGGWRSAGESPGYAYGIYDFNGDGIGDIVLGQPFAPPAEDALMAAGAMISLRDLVAVSEPFSGFPPAIAAGDSHVATPPIPELAVDAFLSGSDSGGGVALHNLASRFDGLFDLSADHFLL